MKWRSAIKIPRAAFKTGTVKGSKTTVIRIVQRNKGSTPRKLPGKRRFPKVTKKLRDKMNEETSANKPLSRDLRPEAINSSMRCRRKDGKSKRPPKEIRRPWKLKPIHKPEAGKGKKSSSYEEILLLGFLERLEENNFKNLEEAWFN